MPLRSTYLGILLTVGILSGCAVMPSGPPGTPIDPVRLSHARYVQVIYTQRHAAKILYLKTLPSLRPAPAPMVCRDTGTLDHHLTRGAWIWKTADLLEHPRITEAFLRKARARRLNSIYLYLAGSLDNYPPLLREARRLGIRVYALAGEPSDVLHPGTVYASIDKVEQYNRAHHVGFSGIQFDIEPYALASFPNHERATYQQYVRLVKAMRAHIAGRIEWGLVVPFWFRGVRLDHQNLLRLVMSETDNVTVMAYRTHYNAIIALANDSLCEGEALHKRVYIGIETSPIPDRTNFIFSIPQVMRHLHYYHGRPYLDHRIAAAKSTTRHHFVPGSEISFYPHIAMAINMTKRHPHYASFSGWIVDGLDEGWHVH